MHRGKTKPQTDFWSEKVIRREERSERRERRDDYVLILRQPLHLSMTSLISHLATGSGRQ